MNRALTTLLALLFLSVGWARAHEVRPAFLELKERAKGEFDVLWKVPAPGGMPLSGEDIPHEQPAPPAMDPNAPQTMPCGCPVPTAEQLARGMLPIHPVLPKGAEIIGFPRTERLFGAEIKRWTIRTTSRGLNGWEVAIHGLPATMVDVLLRIELLDGRVVSRMLRPDSPSFVFSDKESGPAASAYFTLGVEHILLGIDHLLFVLALILIVKGAGRLVKTITAFTVAHSITLALATLGHVNMPSAPVEAVIALSIVFVAAEIVRSRRGQPGLTERAPWIAAFTFGLLHGFGFAGALSEVGLPQNDIPLALFLFNAGVEAGQLAFVAVVMVLIAPVRRSPAPLPRWITLVPPYAIGSLAMFWVLQRVTAL
ncbi:MAG: HupE/UreJ family protein [Verrucomicrobiales bacterium]|nr:HupE/UreJ family protein [Verrucomicrobiales bacterium]